MLRRPITTALTTATAVTSSTCTAKLELPRLLLSRPPPVLLLSSNPCRSMSSVSACPPSIALSSPSTSATTTRLFASMGAPSLVPRTANDMAVAATACDSLPSTFSIVVNSSNETTKWASIISDHVRHVDAILLHGNVGAGKSEFARSFLRHITQMEDLLVTSPTYTLMIDYFHRSTVFHHLDLYRVEPTDLSALDLPSVFSSGVSLVEWPDRLGALTPRHALHVEITQPPSLRHRNDVRQLVFRSEDPYWRAHFDQWRSS